MSEKSSNRDAESEEVVSVAATAARLGVSERTVYRLLKEGTLRRAKECKRVGRTSAKIMSEVRKKEVVLTQNVSGLSDNSKINDIQTTLNTLQAGLREKDEQISKLIQSNLEMQKSVHEVQGQILEIVDVFLSKMKSANSQTTMTEISRPSPEQEGFISRLLHSRRRP